MFTRDSLLVFNVRCVMVVFYRFVTALGRFVTVLYGRWLVVDLTCLVRRVRFKDA